MFLDIGRDENVLTGGLAVLYEPLADEADRSGISMCVERSFGVVPSMLSVIEDGASDYACPSLLQ